jgi:hypothetical protein
MQYLELGLGWNKSLIYGGDIIWKWFGHVERKGDDDWVKRCTRLEVVGKRPRG